MQLHITGGEAVSHLRLAVAWNCHDSYSPSEVPTPSKVPSALTSKAVMGAWQTLLCRKKFISPLCRSCTTAGGIFRRLRVP